MSTHWPSTMTPEGPADNAEFLDYLRSAIPVPGTHRLYFDFGTEELDSEYEPHQRVIDGLMRELGYQQGSLWQTHRFEGAGHNEASWQERVHIPLKFLLAPADAHEQ